MANQNRSAKRREVLRWLLTTGAAAGLAACSPRPAVTDQPENAAENQPVKPEPKSPKAVDPTSTVKPEESAGSQLSAENPTPTQLPAAGKAYLSVARGESPAAITEAALKALGGIERFVKNGYDVIVKPNICTDYYSYEYAATTNPEVVAALVRLALGAGAKRVRVMDFPFGGSAESAYVKSGISDAVKAAGGEMVVMNPNKFKKTAIPQGKSIQEWPIYQDVLSCDLLIDVPTAKHHNLARITVAEKNLMGVVQNRNGIHYDLGQRIADLVSVIRPGLTVVDAVRTLMNHGPTGGNLNDVRMNNTIIASHDIVAADAYAATLFDLAGADIPYIQLAADMGLGTLDLAALKIEEMSV